YSELGLYTEAAWDLERAVALSSQESTLNDHLGDAYWKIGRKLDARFQWNHARDMKPEAEDLPRILAKIDKGLDAVEAEKPATDKPPANAPVDDKSTKA